MENSSIKSALGTLLRPARLRNYKKDETILFQNDPILDIFIIKSGAVCMHDVDNDTRKILHIFGPGALFPMVSFSSSSVSAAWFYSAIVATEVYVLAYADLKRRLENPDGNSSYNLLLRQLLAEVHELIIRIINSSKTPSQGKLAGALRFLAKHHSRTSRAGWSSVRFAVSHQLLADMAGLARETVSVQIKQLQEKNCVRSTGLSQLDIHLERLNKVSP